MKPSDLKKIISEEVNGVLKQIRKSVTESRKFKGPFNKNVVQALIDKFDKDLTFLGKDGKTYGVSSRFLDNNKDFFVDNDGYEDVMKYKDIKSAIVEGKGQDLADKYVAKLRSEFRKLNDDELDEFRKTIAQAFDLKESVDEGIGSWTSTLDDLIAFGFGNLAVKFKGNDLGKVKDFKKLGSSVGPSITLKTFNYLLKKGGLKHDHKRNRAELGSKSSKYTKGSVELTEGEVNEGLKVKDWHEETRPDQIVVKASNGKTLEIKPKRNSSEKSYQAWLQALDQYKTNPKVASAVDKAITQMANESVNEASKSKMVKQIERAIKDGDSIYTLPIATQDYYRKNYRDFKSVNEAAPLLKQAKLSSAEYQKAKKLKRFNPDDYKWDGKQQLYIKESVNEGKTISKGKIDLLGKKILNKIKIGTIFDTKGGQYKVTGYGPQANAFKEFEAEKDGKAVKVKLTAMYGVKLEVTDDVRSARYNKEESLNSIILESVVNEGTSSDQELLKQLMKARAMAAGQGKDSLLSGIQKQISKLQKKLKNESVTEASRGKVHKAAKKGSYPVTLVAIENGKVINQKEVKTPEAVPAEYNMCQKKYPNANITIEDRTGKILFSESVNEAEFKHINKDEHKIKLAIKDVEKKSRLKANRDKAPEYEQIALNKIMLSKVLGREKLSSKYKAAWEKLKKEYSLKESKMIKKNKFSESTKVNPEVGVDAKFGKVIAKIPNSKITRDIVLKTAKKFNVDPDDAIAYVEYGWDIDLDESVNEGFTDRLIKDLEAELKAVKGSSSSAKKKRADLESDIKTLKNESVNEGKNFYQDIVDGLKLSFKTFFEAGVESDYKMFEKFWKRDYKDLINAAEKIKMFKESVNEYGGAEVSKSHALKNIILIKLESFEKLLSPKDKKEYKKAFKPFWEVFSELTSKIEIGESVNEAKKEPIVDLLKQGQWATVGMGEKKLVKLSDAFDAIRDEQADAIASHLNMAIELIQDGESKYATSHMNKFNKACQKEFKLMKKQGLAEAKLITEYTDQEILDMLLKSKEMAKKDKRPGLVKSLHKHIKDLEKKIKQAKKESVNEADYKDVSDKFKYALDNLPDKEFTTKNIQKLIKATKEKRPDAAWAYALAAYGWLIKEGKLTEIRKGDYVGSGTEVGLVNKVSGQVAYVKFDSRPKSFHPILIRNLTKTGKKHKGKDLYEEGIVNEAKKVTIGQQFNADGITWEVTKVGATQSRAEARTKSVYGKQKTYDNKTISKFAESKIAESVKPIKLSGNLKKDLNTVTAMAVKMVDYAKDNFNTYIPTGEKLSQLKLGGTRETDVLKYNIRHLAKAINTDLKKKYMKDFVAESVNEGLSSSDIRKATDTIKKYVKKLGSKADGEVDIVAGRIADILRWDDKKRAQLADYLRDLNQGSEELIFGA
jgi:hypothetical protein